MGRGGGEQSGGAGARGATRGDQEACLHGAGELAGIAAGLEDSVVGYCVRPDVALTRLHHLQEGQSLQI